MDKTDPIDVLARTIYGEARGEFYQGMAAVASVVMNRVFKGGWWGDDVISVCLKPWQFSCWNSKDPNLAIIEEVTDADPIFAQCLKIAKNAVNGLLTDQTNGATSYFDRRMAEAPEWALGMEPCAIIGHHLMYKDVD